MDSTARFQENLRRLAIIDDGFVEDQARLGLALDTASALDPKIAAYEDHLRQHHPGRDGSPAATITDAG